jgi:predicted NBD/HSP70 family sugar kinase
VTIKSIERSRVSNGTGSFDILRLIRSGQASTRAELARITGLSRSTISQRIDELMARGLVVVGDESISTGGRPPGALLFNRNAGYVLAVDCGASTTHLGIANLGGELVAEHTDYLDVAEGPEKVLHWMEINLRRMISEAELDDSPLLGVGVGLPGPVEHSTGRPVRPPIMPGWDGYPVADQLSHQFGVLALVDNDVNIMALGEHRLYHPDSADFLFIKISTGIGCGMVINGNIHRGAHGAAGDIGHINVPGHEDVQCACGNFGCLEAVASARAIASQLSDIDPDGDKAGQIVAQVLGGRPDAIAKLRDAGREIGGVLAMLVNSYDPDVLVVGGHLAEADQPLIAGIREVIYRRSPPLATHNLRIERSQLGDRSGVVGCALMVVDHILDREESATF